MKTIIQFDNKKFQIDLSKPIDLSIPLSEDKKAVNAFYVEPLKTEPFRMGDFVGSVKEGGSCNVNNIFFNPHGNGTHTECVGHISVEKFTIHQCLKNFFFFAQLISVEPEFVPNGDNIISYQQIKAAISRLIPHTSLIIRTLPNDNSKLFRQYSGSNPPYIQPEAMQLIQQAGIDHLLIDTPSVDKENDGGKLLAHRAFWLYPENTRKHCTITEMVYVPNEIKDGDYFLNLQIAGFENDASPSKPVIFEIITTG